MLVIQTYPFWMRQQVDGTRFKAEPVCFPVDEKTLARLEEGMLGFIVSVVLNASFAVDPNFKCTPKYIWNADGPIWCAEGHTVTIWGVDAPSIPAGCATPTCAGLGWKARERLLKQLRPQTLKVLPTGHIQVEGAKTINCITQQNARTTDAVCHAGRLDEIIVLGAVDLGCLLIRQGHAKVEQYARKAFRACLSKDSDRFWEGDTDVQQTNGTD